MKRILLSAALLLGLGAFLLSALGASSGSAIGSYKIELDNAFGLVQGADFKVAGVRAGTLGSINLCFTDPKAHCSSPTHAVVTVDVTVAGFSSFRADAFCQSRPQSLIGEYFIDCQPGHSGAVLKPGSTIPVSRTQSTIPADLLQNVMRMPYRERFTLIINELGAGVAARSGDLAAALRRAVPALDQTDNLLNLLANDSGTLQQLTVNSDSVITTLANNSATVNRFINEANRAASATATQDTNLRATFQKLPGFLEQLRPAMQKLGDTATANGPVLTNLNAASGQLKRLFTNLPSFSRSALPALNTLGKASVTGKQAVKAAGPTIADLNTFARSTPELAQNLAIVLRDLDSRSRAVEADSRSPGGKGYTGLEALLQYVFNQTLAINSFTQFGHILAVDAFIDPRCAQYATPTSVAASLQKYGPTYRECYAWLGPNQPGVNEPDPSNPKACVPDPGGAPPGERGPAVTACKLAAADTAKPASAAGTHPAFVSSTSRGHAPAAANSGAGSPPTVAGGSGSGAGAGSSSASALGLGSIGQLLGGILGPGTGARASNTTSPSSASGAGSSPATPTSSAAQGGAAAGKQAQQLLSYLLAP